MIAFQWLVTLFFNSFSHESEKFVLSAFLLKGPKVIILTALYVMEFLKDKIMKATAFDQIYTMISKDPFD